jgi:hypothetical protein
MAWRIASATVNPPTPESNMPIGWWVDATSDKVNTVFSLPTDMEYHALIMGRTDVAGNQARVVRDFIPSETWTAGVNIL